MFVLTQTTRNIDNTFTIFKRVAVGQDAHTNGLLKMIQLT